MTGMLLNAGSWKPIFALFLGCLHLDRAVASDDDFHVTPIQADDRTDDSVRSGLPMANREGLWCGAPPSGMRLRRIDSAARAAMALTPRCSVSAVCASREE